MKALLLAGTAFLAACAAGSQAGPVPPGEGERVFQKCYSCHSIERVEAKLAGPRLGGIVGRRIAAEAGFDYSPALRRFAEREQRWSADLLDRYIADPATLVPSTSMAFNGIADKAERDALVAYLSATGR